MTRHLMDRNSKQKIEKSNGLEMDESSEEIKECGSRDCLVMEDDWGSNTPVNQEDTSSIPVTEMGSEIASAAYAGNLGHKVSLDADQTNSLDSILEYHLDELEKSEVFTNPQSNQEVTITPMSEEIREDLANARTKRKRPNPDLELETEDPFTVDGFVIDTHMDTGPGDEFDPESPTGNVSPPEEALDNNFQCAICQDMLSCPAKLSCGHIFDQICLMRHFRSSTTCPLCRQVSSITEMESNSTIEEMKQSGITDEQIAAAYSRRQQEEGIRMLDESQPGPIPFGVAPTLSSSPPGGPLLTVADASTNPLMDMVRNMMPQVSEIDPGMAESIMRGVHAAVSAMNNPTEPSVQYRQMPSERLTLPSRARLSPLRRRTNSGMLSRVSADIDNVVARSSDVIMNRLTLDGADSEEVDGELERARAQSNAILELTKIQEEHRQGMRRLRNSRDDQHRLAHSKHRFYSKRVPDFGFLACLFLFCMVVISPTLPMRVGFSAGIAIVQMVVIFCKHIGEFYEPAMSRIDPY